MSEQDDPQPIDVQDDPYLLKMWLPALQRWYEQTGNPLYVWQAMAQCLSARPQAAIPDWCMPYLTQATTNMALLSRGKDFRDEARKQTVSPDSAKGLVGEALALWKSKSKNAFAKLKDDTDDVQSAINYDLAARREAVGPPIIYMENGKICKPPTPVDVREKLQSQANVSDDRANRRLQRGFKLYR